MLTSTQNSMSLWLNRLTHFAVVANYYRGFTRMLSANRPLALITALFHFVGVSLGLFVTLFLSGLYADCTLACCFTSNCGPGLWVHRSLQYGLDCMQSCSMDTCDIAGSLFYVRQDKDHCEFLLLLPD